MLFCCDKSSTWLLSVFTNRYKYSHIFELSEHIKSPRMSASFYCYLNSSHLAWKKSMEFSKEVSIYRMSEVLVSFCLISLMHLSEIVSFRSIIWHNVGSSVNPRYSYETIEYTMNFPKSLALYSRDGTSSLMFLYCSIYVVYPDRT